MRVMREHNGVQEILWHIQNMNICSDGTPFDIFTWSDHEPKDEDIKKLAMDEFGYGRGTEDDDEIAMNYVNEMLDSSEIYAVYVEED